jgi:hypothetical protein
LNCYIIWHLYPLNRHCYVPIDIRIRADELGTNVILFKCHLSLIGGLLTANGVFYCNKILKFSNRSSVFFSRAIYFRRFEVCSHWLLWNKQVHKSFFVKSRVDRLSPLTHQLFKSRWYTQILKKDTQIMATLAVYEAEIDWNTSKSWIYLQSLLSFKINFWRIIERGWLWKLLLLFLKFPKLILDHEIMIFPASAVRSYYCYCHMYSKVKQLLSNFEGMSNKIVFGTFYPRAKL